MPWSGFLALCVVFKLWLNRQTATPNLCIQWCLHEWDDLDVQNFIEWLLFVSQSTVFNDWENAYDTSIVPVLHPHEKMHTSHFSCFTRISRYQKFVETEISTCSLNLDCTNLHGTWPQMKEWLNNIRWKARHQCDKLYRFADFQTITP
jgi:hypothetical protein